jgi:hypothetical protein
MTLALIAAQVVATGALLIAHVFVVVRNQFTRSR